MARVYVSIGSNVEPEGNIRSCLRVLEERFGPLTVSSVYRSEAVGFAGDDFYNLVVGFITELGVRGVAACLREIEAVHKRCRDAPKFSSRTLDLDLLLYDDLVVEENSLQIPRPEITRYGFVLCPLAEVAGQLSHPLLGATFAELWEALAENSERLHPVVFEIPLE